MAMAKEAVRRTATWPNPERRILARQSAFTVDAGSSSAGSSPAGAGSPDPGSSSESSTSSSPGSSS